MPMTRLLPVLLLLLAVATTARAAKLEVASPARQTALIELYTSEGCSSCPPADRWLSRFKDDPRLWQQVVPVAFHVDYWNYLGWIDRFSDSSFTQRQYQYRQYGHVTGVYTPGLLVNGREWRGWVSRRRLPQNGTGDAGILKVSIDGNQASAEYRPGRPLPTPVILNVAVLAFNQSTEVGAGENSGRSLRHDFVVVDFHQYPQATLKDHYDWSLDGLPSGIPDNASGIALWVSAAGDPTPLQATGGMLHDR